MLVLSLLSSLLMVSLCNLLLPIVKMVPVLMLLPGIFGVDIGSVHFSTSRFSTLLCTLIFAPIFPDVTSFMNVKKRWAYDEHVRKVERACFSPLVFAATVGMGPTATTVFRKLASMLAEKHSINYSKCLFWLRCRLCFSLLKSEVMCLRGHRSSVGCPSISNIDLAYSEGHLEFSGLV